MSLTTRRRRPLDRSTGHLRDARLVVVATEGRCTERQYFSLFRKHDSRVQVKILETADGKSAPKHVLARLREFEDGCELKKGDVLCLVIDKDRWPEEQLAKVAAEARRRQYEFAVSCPCFEVWLYAHHADLTPAMGHMSCREVQEELRHLLGGYDRANLQPGDFEPHVTEAVRRTRGLDAEPTARWPLPPGSRVYRVIERIRGLPPK